MFAALMPRFCFGWRRARLNASARPRRKPRFAPVSRFSSWREAKKQKKAEYNAARLIIRLNDVLLLDENQQGLLTQLLDEMFALKGELKKARGQRKNEVLSLLEEPRFDRQKAMSLVREKTRAIDERAAEIVMALAEFSDSLEPQQRRKLHGVVARAFGNSAL